MQNAVSLTEPRIANAELRACHLTGGADPPTAQRPKIRHAVWTGFLSKAISFQVQLSIVPLSIGYLGADGYAAYSILLVTASLPTLVALRFSPALLAQVAACCANDEHESIAKILWSASLLLAVSLTLAGALLLVILILGESLTGWDQAKWHSYRTALACFGIVAILNSCFTVTEIVQTGMHEQHWQNIRNIVGSALAFVSLLFLFPNLPSVLSLLMCVHAPALSLRFINLILFLHRYPRLRPTSSSISVEYAKQLAADSGYYTIIAGAAAYGCNQAPILIMSTTSTTSAVVLLSAIMSLATQAVVALGSLSGPVIASLADGRRNGNRQWNGKFSNKTIVWAAIAFTLSMPTIILLGKPLLELYLRSKLEVPALIALSAAMYGVSLLVDYYSFCLLVAFCPSMERNRAYVRVLCRSLLVITAASVAAMLKSVFFFLIVSSLITLVVTSVPFYRKLVAVLNATEFDRVKVQTD